MTLVTDAKQSAPSLGVRLLGDLRQAFGDRDVMFSDDIIKRLCDIEESPWADLRGKPIDARGLATRLRGYGIKSGTVRSAVDGEGLQRADHTPGRYLPPLSLLPCTSHPSHPSQPRPRKCPR